MTTPRLIQLNNPMGLVKSSVAWLGKVKSSDSKFEEFKYPYYGLRAGLLNVKSKIFNGYNTLPKLVEKLSPASDNNNTAVYIQHLQEWTGINANADLTKLWNENTAGALALAITVQENGWDQVGADTDYNLDLVKMVAKDVINGTVSFVPPRNKWIIWASLALLAAGIIALLVHSNKKGAVNA